MKNTKIGGISVNDIKQGRTFGSGMNKILVGDVLEQVKTLPDKSVNCVVTSPPYYGLRNYNVEGQWGLENHPQEWVDKMVNLCRELRRVLKDDGVMYWNIGETYYGSGGAGGDYAEGGLKEGQPVWKQNNTVKSNWLRPKQLLGLPWRFAIAMQEDGWLLRNAIIWSKSNAMPQSVKDRFANKYEYIFLFAKKSRYWFDLDAVRIPHQYPADVIRRMNQDKLDGIQPFDKNSPSARRSTMTKQQQHPNPTVRGFNERWKAKNLLEKGQTTHSMHENRAMGLGEPQLNVAGKSPGDVWQINTRPHPFAHFAVMAEELVERCVLSGCPKGGVVLDPFIGSGTVAVVAKRLGRQYLGIELNEEYVKIAQKRLAGYELWRELIKSQKTL